jgi:hypothetical protein
MADEVDEELANLPPPKLRRNPLLAGAGIALALLVGWQLRSDVRYAFRGGSATDLGDARALAGPLVDDSYVTLRGLPDRRNALYLEPRGEKSRLTFYRLLGTRSRLFVRATDGSIEDHWSGRLRRFDDVPWAPSLRDYFAREVKARRYLAPDQLKAALAHQPVKDRGGEPITLAPSTVVAIDVADPDKVEALLPRDKFADVKDAEREVKRLGLTTSPGVGNDDSFGVFVDAPAAQRNAILAKLEQAGYGFQAHHVRSEAPLDKISLDKIPFAQVQSASVDEPVQIAADAFVLSEGEAPGAFWWAPAIALLLLAFVAFNVWYLLRRRK